MSMLDVSGYLAVPSAGKGAAVLVIPAWWGLNPFFKQVCDRLAEVGCLAFGYDLYHGTTATTIEAAKQLRSTLDRDAAEKELKQLVGELLAHPAASGSQLGVMGFSLGAGLALTLARTKPDEVGAVVLFYGTGAGKVDKVRAACLGHFAEHDAWRAGPDSARALEQKLVSAGCDVTFHIYPGVEHWFFEANQPAFDPDAARLAWERTVQFLTTHLQ